MQKLNIRRAVVLLVAVIVVAGSTHLLHSFQLQRNSLSFKNQARAAWNAEPKRVLEAITLMRVYLGLEPADFEAREELGSWYAGSGHFSTASILWEELVRTLDRQDPKDVVTIQRVRRKVIEAAVAQGRCTDAVVHLDILKRELPGDVDVLNLLGKCKISLGQEAEAINNFSEAIALRPDRVDIWYNKAMALRFPPIQKLAEAEKCMVDMIAVPANAKWAGAHHVYGVWFDEIGKHEEALKQAEITLSLQKDHSGGLYLAGQSELALRHFPKAEEYARRGMQAAPQDFAMYTLMADILVRNNQRDKAIAVLKSGIEITKAKGAKVQILWHLANLYLDSRGGPDAHNVADAVDCMRRMRTYHFSPVQMDFLDARVRYANDDWKTAREQFEKVRSKLNDFPQLMKCLDYWIGYCYFQQGNPDQAMAAFRRSLSFDKFYFKARDGIAQIFTANGQFKDAAEEYRQAAMGNSVDTEAWQAYARALVRWNRHRGPTEQNWDEVERVLKRTENLSPHEGQVKLLIAEMLLARGQDQRASELIKALREDSPNGVEYWIAQASLAELRGDVGQANQILAEARNKLGDGVLIRLARATMLLRESGFQAGAEIEKLADDVDAFSVEDKVRLWSGLLNNLAEIKEYDRAKRLCRQIAEEQPHDATIRYRLFELALVTHDARDPAASLAELDRVLDEIDDIAGQGPLWMYGKAVRLTLEAAQGKPELLDAAWDYAKRAQEMRLTWSRPHVLKGEICRQRGNNEEAVDCYIQASINGDHDLEFIRLLLQMLFERQRYQEAEQVIHRLDNSQTILSAEILQQKAQIFALWGDFNRALEFARDAYDSSSNDYREHVWHGQVLKLLARRAQREGHKDKLPEIARQAEESLRRACQIAPNTAECRVELVQLLVATEQKEKARIAASDAREMIAAQASPLAMGYIYEALGEIKQAGLSYEKAVKDRPDQPLAIRVLADFYLRNQDIQRATPQIERLLGGDLQASESDLASARRMKAVILAGQGYSRLKEANELIDRNLASPLAYPQDKRLKIRFLLADPGRARSPEVLELAESLVMTGGAEPDPDDRYQLAQLYLGRGDWEHCREQMEKLVNGSQSNPRYLAVYVRMLLNRNELGDAEEGLDRLERVSNPGLTVPLHVELLYRRKEWGKVPGFLAAYVGQEKAEPNDPLDRSLVAARLLEALAGRSTAPAQRDVARSYLETARQWYESYVQKRPAAAMLLGFQARCGKVEEALRGLERYGEKSDPRDVFEVAGAVVSRAETTPAQLAKLESIVSALLDKTQRPTPLLIVLAQIQSARGRLLDSENIYREILRKDPHNDSACNNLSTVLALQKTKLDEALELIEKTIQRAGPQGPFLDTRALVHIARHEPRRALDDLDLALTEKATPLRLFHRAWAYHELAMGDKAKESLRSARKGGLEDSMLVGPEREVGKLIAQNSK